MPARAGRPNSAHRTAIVVAHTHWDREWYLPFEAFRISLVRLIDAVLDLLEREPEFQFFTLDGQTVVLEDYADVRPEGLERLAGLVRAGRLIIGPWYVLPDEFLVSAEALVRNLMLGRETGARFGPVMNVGYVPDPFGHVAQLPQILAGFGIDSFIFSRGLGDEGEWLGSEFHWLAPDGTAVLAVHQIGWDDRSTGYLNASSLGYPSPWVPRQGGPDLDLAVRQLGGLCGVLSRYARSRFLLVNNGCDHLPPQRELPEILALANQTPDAVTFEQGTFSHYIESVRCEGEKLGEWNGELRGSRYSPLLSGVLSTRLHLKQENDRAQSLLEAWAEPWSAVASLEGKDYPKAFLWRAWRYLLQNQPHDSICGCSIDPVHDEMIGRFAKTQQIGEQLTAEALEHVAANADTSWVPAGALPIAVFNPLGWSRSGFVSRAIDLPDAFRQARALEIVTSDGQRLSCQLLGRRFYEPQQGSDSNEVEMTTLGFVAEDVPALGYRTFALRPTDGGGDTVSDRQGIENDLYQVMANRDGTVDLVHKPTGGSVRAALRLVDEADGGDEYTFSPLPGDVPCSNAGEGASVSVLRAGPVSSTLAIDYKLELPAGLTNDRKARAKAVAQCGVHLEVTLYSGIDRVEVRGTIDNRAADHRLRLLVPTGITTDRVWAAGHFGAIERAAGAAHSGTWAEEPTATSHHGGFVDVSDGNGGVTVIARGLPEYEALCIGEVHPVTLALTLLRSVGWLSRDDIKTRPGHAGPGLSTPGAQCLGPRSFEMAIYLHQGNWLEGLSYRQALEHGLPMRVVQVPKVESGAPASLPPAQGFLGLEGEGLVLSAVKRAEGDDRLVVRLYNIASAPRDVRLTFHRRISEAALLRLDESEVERLTPDADGGLTFRAPAAKILTFGVRLV